MRTRPGHEEDGATAVEFALVFPVALFMITLLIYGLFYASLRVTAEHAVRRAVSQAELPIQNPDGSQGWTAATDGCPASSNPPISKLVTSGLPSDFSGLLKLDPDVPSTLSYDAGHDCSPQSGDLVTVTSHFRTPALAGLQPLASLFGAFPLPTSITVSASGRVE